MDMAVEPVRDPRVGLQVKVVTAAKVGVGTIIARWGGGATDRARAKGIKRLWTGWGLMVGVLDRSACFNCK